MDHILSKSVKDCTGICLAIVGPLYQLWFSQIQRPRTLSKIVRNLSNFNCGNVVKHGLSSLHPIKEGGVSGIRPYESLGLKGLTSYFCMFRFVDSECIVVCCGFSLEGVNVVLQMLDLLCKLKNDVKGLKVYGKGICLSLVKIILVSCAHRLFLLHGA